MVFNNISGSKYKYKSKLRIGLKKSFLKKLSLYFFLNNNRVPEDPVFGPWYNLNFFNLFFECSTRYYMQPKN
jgi:hypothetical protein